LYSEIQLILLSLKKVMSILMKSIDIKLNHSIYNISVYNSSLGQLSSSILPPLLAGEIN
jgi:hypothetical protein